ncbi:MAG: class I SAM-dependent methyltransferase [bacterium]|nr:class I SAM-dependent methyltransferase [bacterium]
MFSDYLYRLNRRYYSDPAVVEDYAGYTSLLAAEETILGRLDGDLRDRRVLDLGVGTGRTTGHLRPLARFYLALDYSANMLGHCRGVHRQAALILCDARRVALPDRSFDVAFYAWNGIDEVDHDDRLRILAETWRVLVPGGRLAFSTHNLDCERISAFRPPELKWRGSLARTLRRATTDLTGAATGIFNRLRMKRREVHAPTHSIVNDHACRFSLLTYYISKRQQARQLEEAGFADVEMVRPDGSPLPIDEECRDDYIYYLARKPA